MKILLDIFDLMAAVIFSCTGGLEQWHQSTDIDVAEDSATRKPAFLHFRFRKIGGNGMSSYTIIHDISLELRERLFESMQNAPDVDLSLSDAATNILLDPPVDTPGNKVLASFYLYHIGINKNLRNQHLLSQPGQSGEQRLPPMSLQLRYLLTPLDDDESTNQLIAGRVLQYFYDYPTLSTIEGEALGNSFGGGSRELRIKPELLSMEQLSQIWNAFNQPYRLCLVFLVEVVALDSARSPIRAPRVVENDNVIGIKKRGV